MVGKNRDFIKIWLIYALAFVMASLVARGQSIATTLHLKAFDQSANQLEPSDRLSRRFGAFQSLSANNVRLAPGGRYLYLLQAQGELRHFKLSPEIRFHRYIPDRTILVEATPEAVADWLNQNDWKNLGSYQPIWKIDPDLKSYFTLENPQRVRVRIHHFRGEAQRIVVKELDLKGLITEAKNPRVEWIERVKAFQLKPQSVDDTFRKVKESIFPERIEAAYQVQKIIKLPDVWKKGYRGKGEIIAVTDSGLDSGIMATLHPDLRGGILEGSNLIDREDGWGDPSGHGTHITGLIIGKGAMSKGRIRGAAYQAKAIVQSLWNSETKNWDFPNNFVEDVLLKAYKKGARIQNISWGLPTRLGEYEGRAQQFDEFLWDHPNHFVVVAAGNLGRDSNRDGRVDEGSIASPGTAKNVLTVGASEIPLETSLNKKYVSLKDGGDKWPAAPLSLDYNSNTANGLAAMSSRGPTRDGRLKPEVVAPGTNILSTRSQRALKENMWGRYDQHYIYSGGTSQATALVTGVAALLRSYLRREMKKVPSAALLKAVLMHSSKDLFPGQFGTLGANRGQEILQRRPGVHQGFGRVNAKAAIGLRDKALVFRDHPGIVPGKAVRIKFELKKERAIEATLVYTDAPASLAVTKVLVNDIDLELRNSKGEYVAVGRDRENSFEFLKTKLLPPGEYSLVVRAHRLIELKEGALPFALIATTPQ